MKIGVYDVGRDGDQLQGTIEWDGEQFWLDPPESLALQGVLNSQLITSDGESIECDNPDAFMDNLPKFYRSSYTYCKEEK